MRLVFRLQPAGWQSFLRHRGPSVRIGGCWGFEQVCSIYYINKNNVDTWKTEQFPIRARQTQKTVLTATATGASHNHPQLPTNPIDHDDRAPQFIFESHKYNKSSRTASAYLFPSLEARYHRRRFPSAFRGRTPPSVQFQGFQDS